MDLKLHIIPGIIFGAIGFSFGGAWATMLVVEHFALNKPFPATKFCLLSLGASLAYAIFNHCRYVANQEEANDPDRV